MALFDVELFECSLAIGTCGAKACVFLPITTVLKASLRKLRGSKRRTYGFQFMIGDLARSLLIDNAVSGFGRKLMRILLAIDDSKFSEAAIRMLISQNRPSKATVRVLHVVDPIESPYYPDLTPPYPRRIQDIQKKRVKLGQQLAALTAKSLRAAGFETTCLVPEGHVRTAIVDAAAKWRANLIVMGSHGRTGLGRLLLGSVSEFVMRHAPCSVQVVRIPRRRKKDNAVAS